MITRRLLLHSFLTLTVCFSCNSFATTQADQDAILFAEIKQFADFASASYLPLDKLGGFKQPAGYTLSHSSNIPGFNIAYFLMTDNSAKSQIIAVRGTANSENALVDAAIQLTPDKHTGVRLHNGFSQAALAIYADVKSHLNKDYDINATGHSLGGAVALVLAMHMAVDQYHIGQVITFGQPKVTNVTGADKFKHLKLIRVVTPKDVVPLVPPVDMTDINNIDIYWHQGKEVVLLADDTYAVLEGVNSMLRAVGFTQELPSENNLNEHQMTLYQELIDSKIPVARLVPFNNNLNLFNLFGS